MTPYDVTYRANVLSFPELWQSWNKFNLVFTVCSVNSKWIFLNFLRFKDHTSFYDGKSWHFNTSRPKQHDLHLADDTFKRISLNENVRISIWISLKFVHKGPINNIPALIQIMAWRWPGDKPLFEPMVGSLLKHICVARPQWVNRRSYIYILDPKVR